MLALSLCYVDCTDSVSSQSGPQHFVPANKCQLNHDVVQQPKNMLQWCCFTSRVLGHSFASKTLNDCVIRTAWGISGITLQQASHNVCCIAGVSGSTCCSCISAACKPVTSRSIADMPSCMYESSMHKQGQLTSSMHAQLPECCQSHGELPTPGKAYMVAHHYAG